MQEMLQDFKAGEFALIQDTTASWKEYRIWYGEIPLQETCGGSFVLIDADLYEELDAFQKKLYSYVDKSFSIVKAQELLHIWSTSCRITIKSLHMPRSTYFLMSPLHLDAGKTLTSTCLWNMKNNLHISWML